MAEKKIEPLRPAEFGMAGHRYQQFDATVKPNVSPADLEDPAMWVNVAPRINPGDEIRVRCEDDSWVALLHVTYSVGSQIRVKTVYAAELDEVDYDKMHADDELYDLKQRGPKKWCIIEKATGEEIKTLIPTKLEALKELDDLKRAMAA